MNTMYDILLQLPLFQGLSVKEFTSIIEKVKLDFGKYRTGELIVESGERCSNLVFLIRGVVEIISTSHTGNISIVEYVEAPAVFEPDALFSLNGHFFSTYKGYKETQIVQMDKSYIFSVLDQFEICRMNFRILLSRGGINLNRKVWDYHPDGAEQNLFSYIYERFHYDFGRKSIRCKMEDLAQEVGMNRMKVSKILNDWSEEGLIELHRQSFEIPDCKAWIEALKGRQV